MDDHPNLELPEIDEKPGFPWVPLLAVILAIGLGALWILYGKSYRGGKHTAIAGLEQQLTTDQAALKEEREKIFTMTQQLDAMKADIAQGKFKEKKQAVDDYNKLAADQRAQREKVQTMSNQYNEKVEQLQKLQAPAP